MTRSLAMKATTASSAAGNDVILGGSYRQPQRHHRHDGADQVNLGDGLDRVVFAPRRHAIRITFNNSGSATGNPNDANVLPTEERVSQCGSRPKMPAAP